VQTMVEKSSRCCGFPHILQSVFTPTFPAWSF